MTMLHDKLEAALPGWRSERERLVAEHGAEAIGQVNVAALFGGLRGVNALVCDTSHVDAQRGLVIRGIPVLELVGVGAEEAFWLLLTGQRPSPHELDWLTGELQQRAALPAHVAELLNKMPAASHPMAMFSATMLNLQRSSAFAASYSSTSRRELWRPALDDALTLLALSPLLAAAVFHRPGGGALRPSGVAGDMAARFAQLLELAAGEEASEMLRLFLLLHCDHESGNVSAFSAHITGSTHAAPHYALSSGLNGLAGPIHGLASESSVQFLEEMGRALGTRRSVDDVRAYCEDRLSQGRLIPGYGHAVLRVLDPRFAALHGFAERHFPDDELFVLCDRLYQVAPDVLRMHGKAASPYPNVDAITGTVLRHYGVADPRFFTVVFGLGLMIGMLAQYVLNTALGGPLVRPRSLTSRELRGQLG